MITRRRIGLIGYGAIGRAIGETLNQMGEADRVVGVLVREGRNAGPHNAVHDPRRLIAAGVDVVLECAGQGAVLEYGPEFLAAGRDVVITSVGALASPSALPLLAEAANRGNGRLTMAAGAVGGLDALLAARVAGLDTVSYTSTKPPHAWRGTLADDEFDLASTREQVLFEGSAREAARLYPKNANVAVAVALCGLGLERTAVRLVSSPKVTDPLGVIEAEGACGRFRFESFAYAAPDNPKTSLLTAYSLLQCARLGQGLPVLDLWREAYS